MKILMSAYACIPGRGSEPGVGWNMAVQMAQHHTVWVITRENNRAAIEAELARNPLPNLHFSYFDLPKWTLFFKRGQAGTHIYYYLWQIGAHKLAKQLNQQIQFDWGHHVTFVKYWAPSFLAFMPFPYIFGPVGGGETAPRAFWQGFGPVGVLFETVREASQRLAELDPWVRLSAQRATVALATTKETAERLRILGAKRIKVVSQVALPDAELQMLASLPPPPTQPFRFISMGNLLHLKGIHLALEAFARLPIEQSEFWVVGDGPEYERLQAQAKALGVEQRIRFWGWLPRPEALQKLAECHVLLHPGLHDSGGFVCVEAMAAGRPVVCLDLGGPAVQVVEGTGYKVAARNPEATVSGMTEAMQQLIENHTLYQQMSQRARQHTLESCRWSDRVNYINRFYSARGDYANG